MLFIRRSSNCALDYHVYCHIGRVKIRGSPSKEVRDPLVEVHGEDEGPINDDDVNKLPAGVYGVHDTKIVDDIDS